MDFAAIRDEMVERQLRRRGIEEPRVPAAMRSVPREEFVPSRDRSRAYADSALPIDEGQTISQPWIVAAICQALELRGSEVVLEVGTGSGYSAAVLARIAARVVSIERHQPLATAAESVLDALGVGNVEVIVGDGTKGLPERSPFAAIAVHATAPGPPTALLGQLAEGGRLVVPVAGDGADLLTVFRRQDGELRRDLLGPCRFVPLVGEEGFGPKA
jgi:protein-L-isoaspartate(D-aspartate) O-methyltransferase